MTVAMLDIRKAAMMAELMAAGSVETKAPKPVASTVVLRVDSKGLGPAADWADYWEHSLAASWADERAE